MLKTLVSKPVRRVTWAQAFRDVGIRFLSSGKFVPFLAFLLLFIAIIRAPSDKMPEIVRTLADQSVAWMLMGWIVAGVLLVVSILFFLGMRRLYLDEITRIKNERDDLQEKLIQRTLQHSRFKAGP
jgi:formate-dependent nitrite reductase membrane component NrfD